MSGKAFFCRKARMNDRQAARLCKRILKLQSKLFAGAKGENYMDIYAKNGANGMPCVGITIKTDKGYKHITMVDGDLFANEI